jgi:dipeptidyl aminopeptidase/acylaminoacyl peptidase
MKSVTPIRLTTGKSPITVDTVALAGGSFSQLRSNGQEVFFVSKDLSNGGNEAIQSLSTTYTTQQANVRSAVHEYGGGAYCILKNGSVLYTDFPSHVLYQSSSSDEGPKTILLEQQNCRFADFSAVTDTKVVCIMEDHTDPSPTNVQNSIVMMDLETGKVDVVASGRDFYSCPQVNADATKIAFIAWDHPNMPWDTAMLYIQQLNDGLLPTGDPLAVDQGSPCSMCEPRWSGERLLFLSDVTGWSNLYEFFDGGITPKYPKDADFCSASQGWILGQTPYVVQSDGTIVASYSDADGAKVVVLPPLGGAVQEFGRDHIPPTSLSSLCATDDSRIYFVGGSTTEPSALYCWDGQGVAQKVKASMDVDLTEIQAAMSKPQLIQYPSTGGVGYAYGYYYPPSRFTAGSDVKPPLLVKAHGGPTSQTSTTFRLLIHFWTSRGFAVLDVDYGGSTGKGAAYRKSLQGKWGIVDVNDVCAGAEYCVQQGWVHPEWLCIDGSSAGGYTTLAALTFRDTFSAGASLYGISDLTALAKDTHKFESRYLDGLVGKYPEDQAIFDERCPILFTDKLSCPILLLQGMEDKVVPPNQAEGMFHALKEKGLLTSLVMYKGEQHGFRKKKNIQHALNSEYSFFCQVFGIEPEEGTEEIAIGERMEM